jgi:hypothetical protein
MLSEKSDAQVSYTERSLRWWRAACLGLTALLALSITLGGTRSEPETIRARKVVICDEKGEVAIELSGLTRSAEFRFGELASSLTATGLTVRKLDRFASLDSAGVTLGEREWMPRTSLTLDHLRISDSFPADFPGAKDMSPENLQRSSNWLTSGPGLDLTASGVRIQRPPSDLVGLGLLKDGPTLLLKDAASGKLYGTR